MGNHSQSNKELRDALEIATTTAQVSFCNTVERSDRTILQKAQMYKQALGQEYIAIEHQRLANHVHAHMLMGASLFDACLRMSGTEISQASKAIKATNGE